MVDYFGLTDFLQIEAHRLPESEVDDAPFLIIHGDADPASTRELLEAALKKVGVPVLFYTVKGGGHGGFTDRKVLQLTREFWRSASSHRKAGRRHMDGLPAKFLFIHRSTLVNIDRIKGMQP